jgi:hypothetical protein
MIEKSRFFLRQFLFIGIAIFCLGTIKYSIILFEYFKFGELNTDITDLVPFFIGLSIFMLKSGFQLEIEKKSLTKFIRFYGLTIWKKKEILPDNIDFVLLTARRYNRYVYFSQVKPTKIKTTLYDVQLVYDNRNKRKKIFQLKKKQAFKYGQVLADFFSVKMIHSKPIN